MRQTVLLCEILQGIPYRVRVDACSIPMLGKAHDTFYGLRFPQNQKYTDTEDLPAFSLGLNAPCFREIHIPPR